MRQDLGLEKNNHCRRSIGIMNVQSCCEDVAIAYEYLTTSLLTVPYLLSLCFSSGITLASGLRLDGSAVKTQVVLTAASFLCRCAVQHHKGVKVAMSAANGNAERYSSPSVDHISGDSKVKSAIRKITGKLLKNYLKHTSIYSILQCQSERRKLNIRYLRQISSCILVSTHYTLNFCGS